MRIARSRSLLSILAVATMATGCFLRGDYEVTEETVTIGAADTTEDGARTQDEPTSSPLPVEPPPPPEPPASTSEHFASSDVATTTTGVPSSAPFTEPAPESTVDVGGTVDASSTVPPMDATSGDTTSSETNGWVNSDDGRWRDSSAECDRQGPGAGNCGESCANGEQQDQQGRCYWFNAGQGTWNQAKTVCANHGDGWLPITIRDEDADAFVSSQINRAGETWLGAQYSMGKWRWIDDDSVFWNGTGPAGSALEGVFAKWGTNEPSGSPGENCGRVESFNNVMRWGDSECGEIKLIACQGPPPGQ